MVAIRKQCGQQGHVASLYCTDALQKYVLTRKQTHTDTHRRMPALLVWSARPFTLFVLYRCALVVCTNSQADANKHTQTHARSFEALATRSQLLFSPELFLTPLYAPSVVRSLKRGPPPTSKASSTPRMIICVTASLQLRRKRE